MEDSGSVRARNAAQGDRNTAQGDQNSSRTALGSAKPLHRFVQKEPKSLGVVLLMFGGAELLIGFIMAPAAAGDKFNVSTYFYTPFWQGTLFIICGTLSIYTGIHPSKKMVTVCLSLYVVSLVGIIVSFGFRISAMSLLGFSRYRRSENPWLSVLAELLITLEALLFLSSVCVSGLLIFLCVVARLALKSTRTQIVLHQIPPPVTETPTEEN